MLQQHGFGGNLLAWFHSYLENRLQRVIALGVSSEALPVTSGVPQSSILGPLLFLSYVNSLLDVVKSSRVTTFVDDTKIFKTIVTQEDSSLLQADLRNLASWSSKEQSMVVLDSGIPDSKALVFRFHKQTFSGFSLALGNDI